MFKLINLAYALVAFSLMQGLKIYTFSLFVFVSIWSKADDVDRNYAFWLGDFFRNGVNSVFAECELKIVESNQSQHFFKRKTFSISFDEDSKTYRLLFYYEYRDDWNVLTDGGSHPPKKEDANYIGSSISQWNNVNGLGIYKESYEHVLPNWMNFQSMDSLLINLSKYNQFSPSLTGIFRSDELSTMKKMYKKGKSEGKVNHLLSCFEFDSKGNLQAFSDDYLKTFNEEQLLISKPIQDYSIVIRNKAEQVLFLKPIISTTNVQIIEGVKFKLNDKTAKVFSFELNHMLYKFAPSIFSDPYALLDQYLKSLQTESGVQFSRFIQ